MTTANAMIIPEGRTYRPLRDLHALTPEQQATVRDFSKLYCDLWRHDSHDGRGTLSIGWFGHLTQKCPFDLWTYQEILVETRPDLVIETGTCYGGSALFLATMFDLLGRGRVITVDIADVPGRPQHPRITYVRGSSAAPEIVRQVRAEAATA